MVVRDQCGGGVDEAIELEAEVLERESLRVEDKTVKSTTRARVLSLSLSRGLS